MHSFFICILVFSITISHCGCEKKCTRKRRAVKKRILPCTHTRKGIKVKQWVSGSHLAGASPTNAPRVALGRRQTHSCVNFDCIYAATGANLGGRPWKGRPFNLALSLSLRLWVSLLCFSLVALFVCWTCSPYMREAKSGCVQIVAGRLSDCTTVPNEQMPL
jgi:hypothetical protein